MPRRSMPGEEVVSYINSNGEGGQFRIKFPKQNEYFGIVEQRLGFNKMYVRCQDNKIRICRIPGKYSRRLWVREGDLVVITPWVIEGDKKGDIIYRYTRAQKQWLVKKKRLPEGFDED